MSDLIRIQTSFSKGKGIYAVRDFKMGDVIIEGRIIKESNVNNRHVCQIAVNRFVYLNDEFSLTNHSCDPNAGIRVNKTGAHDLVAKRNIKIDQEITFDYAMQNYVVEHFPSECLCGSPDCRKKITGWRNLPHNKKEEYQTWSAPYLFELDKLARNIIEK